MKHRGIPEPRAWRLARLWVLVQDLAAQGRERVTSQELGRWLGTGGPSIRRDLLELDVGARGAAYPVPELARRLESVLKPSQPPRVALVGLGPLGLGLWEQLDQGQGLWQVVAGFDSRPNRLEQLDLPIPLFPTTEIPAVVARMEIATAVLAVPAPEAQRMAERLALAGIRGILNFSPAVLRLQKRGLLVRDCLPPGELLVLHHLLG